MPSEPKAFQAASLLIGTFKAPEIHPNLTKDSLEEHETPSTLQNKSSTRRYVHIYRYDISIYIYYSAYIYIYIIVHIYICTVNSTKPWNMNDGRKWSIRQSYNLFPLYNPSLETPRSDGHGSRRSRWFSGGLGWGVKGSESGDEIPDCLGYTPEGWHGSLANFFRPALEQEIHSELGIQIIFRFRSKKKWSEGFYLMSRGATSFIATVSIGWCTCGWIDVILELVSQLLHRYGCIHIRTSRRPAKHKEWVTSWSVCVETEMVPTTKTITGFCLRGFFKLCKNEMVCQQRGSKETI